MAALRHLGLYYPCRTSGQSSDGEQTVPDTVSRNKDRSLPEEPNQPTGRRDKQLSPEVSFRSGLADLAALARLALEERRRKDCMVLTRAILKIDPENPDAQVMQNWIQTDLQREVQQGYELMRSARYMTDIRGPCERARLVFRDILDVDPDNEDAQILLSRVESMLQSTPPSFVEPASQPQRLPNAEPGYPIDDRLVEIPPVKPNRARSAFLVLCMIVLGAVAVVLLTGLDQWRDLLGFSPAIEAGTLEIFVDDGVRVLVNDEDVGTAPLQALSLPPGLYKVRYEYGGVNVGSEDLTVRPGQATKNTAHALLGRLQFLVIPASNAKVRIDDGPAIPVPSYLDVKAGTHRLTFTATGYRPQTVSVSVDAGGQSNVKAILTPALPPPPVSEPEPRPAPPVGRSTAAEPVVMPNGFLAVSSPFPVEVYMDSKRVGSTPATLELPPGSHVVEYRYNGMSKRIVHVIESRQTTRATVTF